MVFFFFQAEDGIRDYKVTGVQTCALPIYVVPETFEASLMLVSHVLMLLHVPVTKVVRTVNDIRNNRYAVLRNIVRRGDARPIDETHEHREEIKSVVVPPGAWAVGRTLRDVRGRGV